MKPQTVQIVRQGEATPYWFKVNPLYKMPSATTLYQKKSGMRMHLHFQTT